MKSKQRLGVAFFAAVISPLLSPAPIAAAQGLRVFYGEGVQSGATVIEPCSLRPPMLRHGSVTTHRAALSAACGGTERGTCCSRQRCWAWAPPESCSVH